MLPTIKRVPVRNIWRDPFDSIDRELNRALSRFYGGEGNETGDLLGTYPVDIHEDDEHVFVDAELPGFKKEEIDVTLEGGVLTITAERKQEPKKTEHLTERRYTRVQRSFTLPTSVNENSVDATIKDGVLKLKLAKHEEVKPRKIQVK